MRFDTDWSRLGPAEVSFDPARGLISIWGDTEAETFVDIRVDDVGTTNLWDDQLRVTMTVYADGPDVIVDHPPQPLYKPGGGSINSWTTQNTPQELYYKKIDYKGSTDVRSAVKNGSPVPMYASGYFADVAGGQQGFSGGDAPECVYGSRYADEIRTFGGSDRVTGGEGDDYIRGGDGDDTIEGGRGDDRLYGDGGADHLHDYSGNDCLDGGQDGRRDWLDDDNTWDADALIAEPGVLNGVLVPTIEYMSDEGAFLSTMCG